MKCINHKDKDAVATLTRKHKNIDVQIGLCDKCFEIWSEESGFLMTPKRKDDKIHVFP